jgi:hypothetical protein
MTRPRDTFAVSLIALAMIFVGVRLLDPEPRWPGTYPMETAGRHALVYPGPESEMALAPGLDPDAAARAEAALAAASYHAAYAEGPGGRTGLWTDAHTVALARDHALALCGAGCRVLAELRPRNAPEAAGAGVVVLRPEMARRVAAESPFLHDGDALAIGGAGAWGSGHAGGGLNGDRRAATLAMLECEARRQAEATPEGVTSPPCRHIPLREVEITDLRPDTPLYPAPYTVDLAELVAVDQGDLRLRQSDGAWLTGLNPLNRPDGLHGVMARNGEGASGWIDRGGWPEVAEALALMQCEARRRYDDPPCTIALARGPAAALPEDTLAVTPDLLSDFRIWQGMEGAGAFAIGPLGAYGSSRGFATMEEARQHAADWCAHYSRRGTAAFLLRRAFFELPPCRIVAERGP